MPGSLDVLVLGDADPDLVLRGDNVAPAFGQAERLPNEAHLTVGGSGAIPRVRRSEAWASRSALSLSATTSSAVTCVRSSPGGAWTSAAWSPIRNDRRG